MSTYIVSAIPENDGPTKHLFTTIHTTTLPPRKDLSLDWIYAVICTLYFSLLGWGGPTSSRRGRRWRSRGIAEITMCGSTGRTCVVHTHTQLSWFSARYARLFPPLLARSLPFVDPPIYSATHSLPVRPPSANPWRPSVTRISNMILR